MALDTESELQRELQAMEDDIHVQSEYMGKLKSEFTSNRNKLRESYWPKLSPLHATVYMAGRIQRDIQREIEWLEKKVVMMESLKSHFIEVRDMAPQKKRMLDDLQPSFREAYLRLEQVTRDELATLRSYDHPPQIVLDIMDLVMVLRNDQERGWEDMKLLLSDTYFFAFFISKCKSAHKQEYSADQLESLRRFLMKPESSVDAVLTVSTPCGAIAQWLHALYDFFFVNQITAPSDKPVTVEELKDILTQRRKALQESKESVSDAHENMHALTEELKQKEKELRSRYDETMIPLQEAFFDATSKFNDVFCSPRRRREEGLLTDQ